MSKASSTNKRLLSLSTEHWERIFSLKERIEKLTPPGSDPPAVEEVGRNAMSLGLSALDRQLSKQEKKHQED